MTGSQLKYHDDTTKQEFKVFLHCVRVLITTEPGHPRLSVTTNQKQKQKHPTAAAPPPPPCPAPPLPSVPATLSLSSLPHESTSNLHGAEKKDVRTPPVPPPLGGADTHSAVNLRLMEFMQGGKGNVDRRLISFSLWSVCGREGAGYFLRSGLFSLWRWAGGLCYSPMTAGSPRSWNGNLFKHHRDLSSNKYIYIECTFLQHTYACGTVSDLFHP